MFGCLAFELWELVTPTSGSPQPRKGKEDRWGVEEIH